MAARLTGSMRVPLVLVLLGNFQDGARGGKNTCADFGGPSGVNDCSRRYGSIKNTRCPLRLSTSCDWMYPADRYTDAGIPCGFEVDPGSGPLMDPDFSCSGKEPISAKNHHWSAEAIDALARYFGTLFPNGVAQAPDVENDIRDYLPVGAGTVRAPEPIAEYSDFLTFDVAQDTMLNITFLGEGACNENSLGMVVFPTADYEAFDGRVGFGQTHDYFLRQRILEENDLTIVLPNVDFRFCRCSHSEKSYCRGRRGEPYPDALVRGATIRLKPDHRNAPDDFIFPAGTSVLFFTLVDGYTKLSKTSANYTAPFIETAFTDGDEELLFSTPQLNNPRMVLNERPNGLPEYPGFGYYDRRQHAVSVTVPPGFQGINDTGNSSASTFYDFSGVYIYSFEDVQRAAPRYPWDRTDSNQDFQDLTFFLEVDEDLTGFGLDTPTPMLSEAPNSKEFCSEGLLSDCGNVCCSSACGGCGGCGCERLPGGPELCCPQMILFNGIVCVLSNEVGCVIDTDAVCPLGTGCAST